MSTSKKQNGTTTGERKGQITKKSGKGLQEGVMSELASFWTVKAGHEDELRAASLRFGGMLNKSDPKDVQRTGLRDARLTIFDNGRRFSFFTTFETDFDPYLDDAFLIVGIEHFLDWLQHLDEADQLMAEVESIGGLKKFDRSDPDFEKRFEVYAYHPHEAMSLIGTDLRRKLLELRQAGRVFAYVGPEDAFVAATAKNKFEAGSMFRATAGEERVRHMFDEVCESLGQLRALKAGLD